MNVLWFFVQPSTVSYTYYVAIECCRCYFILVTFYSCLERKTKDQRFTFSKLSWRISCNSFMLSGLGSSVRIVTGYGMDSPGIESWWGRDFLHLSRPALGPTQPPVQLVPGLPRGVKSGRGVTLTPHPLLVPLVMKE